MDATLTEIGLLTALRAHGLTGTRARGRFTGTRAHEESTGTRGIHGHTGTVPIDKEKSLEVSAGKVSAGKTLASA